MRLTDRCLQLVRAIQYSSQRAAGLLFCYKRPGNQTRTALFDESDLAGTAILLVLNLLLIRLSSNAGWLELQWHEYTTNCNRTFFRAASGLNASTAY